MQVFYIEDPADRRKHVVLPGKRRIVGVGNVVDEDEYDHVDEIPPFSTGIEPLPIDENEDEAICLRSNNGEGIWEDTPIEDAPTKKNSRKRSKKKANQL